MDRCPFAKSGSGVENQLQTSYDDNERRSRGEARMTFGERLRELRKAKNLSQRALGDKVGINFTYLSKVESEKLDFAQYPSEDLIRKLAKALGADEDELLLLAKKIPTDIRDRVIERPDAFRKIASLDDETLDAVLKDIERKEKHK
jgi:transcriptional regulator with XRE-family HTH domain